jgi:hypothetical protein
MTTTTKPKAADRLQSARTALAAVRSTTPAPKPTPKPALTAIEKAQAEYDAAHTARVDNARTKRKAQDQEGPLQQAEADTAERLRLAEAQSEKDERTAHASKRRAPEEARDALAYDRTRGIWQAPR